MEDSGECCVIIPTKSGVEKDPAPQVTSIQAVPSPPAPDAGRRNKEETPNFEERDGVQDNSTLKQGRLLFLTCTPETSTDKDVEHCVDCGPSSSSTTTADIGTKNPTDVGAPKSEVMEVESSKESEVVPLTANSSPSAKTAAASGVSVTTPPAPPKVVRVKLTKQQREAMRLEREKQRAERERQRAQKEKEKAEAKARREEEREIRKMEKQRKEEEKKERQRKREQEIKERQQRREWEEKMKQQRKQAKEEERKRREEERKRLELEKEQAKEEKLRKELQGQKRISSFFHILSPKGTVQNKTVVDSDFFILTPFPTKPDVTMATPPRPPLQDSTHFDSALSKQDSSVGRIYLEECKHKPKLGQVGKTKEEENKCDKNEQDVECMDVEVDDEDDDVIITSTSMTCDCPKRRRNMHYKLLQFHTNHRPAYFGTWRKRSKMITPRNPFKKDVDLLDYEVDSDDEWEEEEPGESLSNSEGEDGGGESGDDEEEEDGFFVPHGYLSDSEGDHSGDEATPGQDNHDLKQQKQVSKAKAWEAEFARKCQPLRPIKIGCIWTSSGGAGQHQEGGVVTVSKDKEFLQQFEAIPLVELPVAIETKGETTAEGGSTGAFDPCKPRAVPEEAMHDLIRLVHKSSMGLGRLMKTFREYWGAKVMASSCSGDPMGTRERSTSPGDDKTIPTETSPFCKPKTPGTNVGNSSELENASGISKRQLERKIQSMAVKEARPPNHRQLWYVHDSVLQKYGIDGNALSPLRAQVVASPSTVATGRGGENNSTSGVNSPQTPCGSGVVVSAASSRKRKPPAKGMKSLFDFVQLASSSAAASSGGGEGQPPSIKKSRIEEGGSSSTAVTKSSKPPLVTLTSSNIHVMPTITSPNGMEPPPVKKARLDLTVDSPKKLKSSDNKDKEVIVIDSEDSNDKEKPVVVKKGATPISLNLVDITNISTPISPPTMSTGHGGALNTTNTSTSATMVAAAPTINLLAKLIQQCANASRH